MTSVSVYYLNKYKIRHNSLFGFMKLFCYHLSKKYMSTKKSQVILVDVEELKEIIQISVRNEFETCLKEFKFGTEFTDETWDRNTTASFLKMSPEKLTICVNRNEIPARKIGREYIFLKSQIVNLFKKKSA